MLESDEKDLSPFKVDVGHNVDQSTLLLPIFNTSLTKGLFGLNGNIAQFDVDYLVKITCHLVWFLTKKCINLGWPDRERNE